MHGYTPVESPWLGRTVRITGGKAFTNRVGQVVRVEVRNPDTFNDGVSYWIEAAPNFQIRCKLGEFELHESGS